MYKLVKLSLCIVLILSLVTCGESHEEEEASSSRDVFDNQSVIEPESVSMPVQKSTPKPKPMPKSMTRQQAEMAARISERLTQSKKQESLTQRKQMAARKLARLEEMERLEAEFEAMSKMKG